MYYLILKMIFWLIKLIYYNLVVIVRLYWVVLFYILVVFKDRSYGGICNLLCMYYRKFVGF